MSSDDDMDWEEILPVATLPPPPNNELSAAQAPIKITIRAPGAKNPSAEALKKQKSESEALERFVRLQSHRIHTVALLANASIRNKWLNDPLLHVSLSNARLNN